MDKWEEVKENLKRLENDPSINQELLRTMDHISLVDYWKRRSEEERNLLYTVRHHLEQQEAELRHEELKTHMLERSFDDKRRLWEKERDALEEKIKVKETEIQLLKERFEWESKFQEAVKKFSGASSQKGIRIPGEGEQDFNEDEIRRLSKEMRMLRDSTEHIEKSTNWLEREKDRMLEALSGKNSPSDMGVIKELLNQVTQQLGVFQTDFFKKFESGVSAKAAVPVAPSIKDDSVVVVGMPGADGDVVKRMWQENLQAYLLIQEDVARGFCHKARNLLGIISGTAQIVLSDEKLSADLKENLTTIDQNVTLLLESIEEFLAMTRYPQLTLEESNLNLLAQEVAGGSQFKFALDQKLPKMNIDKKLIKEAIGCVIENAREAGNEGSPITMGTKYDEKEKHIYLTVQDQGKGIGENHFKKVFQPYFTTKKDKRGIGLSKALHATNLHGGNMKVESTKGVGTTVFFVFPVI